jgi:lantibiotic modifying enzyme
MIIMNNIAVELKLEEFRLYVEREIEHFPVIGVKKGKLGALLFLMHYYKEKQIENTELIEDVLWSVLNNVELIYESDRPSQELAELGWFVHYIEKEGLYEIDSDELLEDIDEVVYKSMMDFVSQQNYDTVFGSVPNALYFLERMTANGRAAEKARQFLNEFVDAVLHQLQHDRDSVIINVNYTGISHGFSGLLLCIINLYEHGVQPDKSALIIKILQKLIWESRLKDFEVTSNSFFPVSLKHYKTDDSKWFDCWSYGDIGILYAQLRIAKLWNDSLLEKEVLELIRLKSIDKVATEKTFRQNDYSVWYGSNGFAFFYQQVISMGYEHDYLLESYNYWVKRTIAFAVTIDKDEDNDPEYPRLFNFGEKYPSEKVLLTGIPAVGMLLLCYINKSHLSFIRFLNYL